LVGALAKKEKLKNIIPHILSQKTQKTIFPLFLNPTTNHTDERIKKTMGAILSNTIITLSQNTIAILSNTIITLS
jgi:hypothetical protein